VQTCGIFHTRLIVKGLWPVVFLSICLTTRCDYYNKTGGVFVEFLYKIDYNKSRNKLNLIKEKKPDGILAGNLGILDLKLDIPIHLDYNCNCFNDHRN